MQTIIKNLNDTQLNRALATMREYLAAPVLAEYDDKTPVEYCSKLDNNRLSLIQSELKPLLNDYLQGKIKLPEFKTKIDGINRSHREYWGFNGIKGQMFFNMLLKSSQDEAECDAEIKAAIELPANEDIARSRMRNFISFTRRLGTEALERGATKYSLPKTQSIAFFLSYFWQIQNHEVWPIYYTSTVQVMTDLNLFQPSGDLVEDYTAFKHLQQELSETFTKESRKKFGLYDVEHLFWYLGRKSGNINETEPMVATSPDNGSSYIQQGILDVLPESYVPPIIAIIPRLARNDSTLESAAKASGITLARALEKNVHAAFAIMGFTTKALGQGTGRNPDGIAYCDDHDYVVIWDAKARADSYTMGTDDRTIREYIATQNRELKRSHGRLNNIYYCLISSFFASDFDDTIRTLKMETPISEVCLLEADALVAMVEAKLRNPNQVTLGPDGIQSLFSDGGIISEETVQELFV